MKYYEILFVLPGTLAETEVTPVVDQVTEIAEKNGAQNIKIYDMGKSRLAYPIKHIRYGYFRLMYLEVEPDKIKIIESKLRLINELLRLVIRISSPEAEEKGKQINLTPQSQTFVQEKQEQEEKTAEKSVKDTETKQVTEEKQVIIDKKEKNSETKNEGVEDKGVIENSKETVEKKDEESTISIDDIEAKLDELLQKDLDKV